jgi:hypothetical protein
MADHGRSCTAPLAPQYDQHVQKIELEKGNSEKPLPPQHPAPVATTDDPATSPPTAGLATARNRERSRFFVGSVFTLFAKHLSSISFRKMNGEYRFFRGKRQFPSVPTGLTPPQAIENRGVTERKRLRPFLFPE